MTLCLTMIVKNECDVLERALRSVIGSVDEIVVVDTGSTDGTADIARKFTEKVYSFEWIDDFAAARNFALSKAVSDHWMWLDADDIVPKKTARFLSLFRKGAFGDPDIVMLPYVLGTDGKGKPTFEYYRERILRNRSDFRWRGNVHEAVELHGNIIYGKAPILHAKPENRASGSRNLDIYKKMLSDGKELEPREQYYYARELYYNGQTEEAADMFRRFLDRENAFAVNKADACILLAQCHEKAGSLQSALRAAVRALAYGPPNGEICCKIGSLYFAENDYRSSAFWYESAVRAKPDPRSGAFVRSEYNGVIPLVWLSVCYDRMGNLKKAFAYHKRAKKLCPNEPSVIANDSYFSKLGFCSDKQGNLEPVSKFK